MVTLGCINIIYDRTFVTFGGSSNIFLAFDGSMCREYSRNSQICAMQNRGKKKYEPKKTITQHNIYVVRRFDYVHGVIMISLFT